jgi:hypothetical protein
LRRQNTLQRVCGGPFVDEGLTEFVRAV